MCVTQSRNLVLQHRSPLLTQNLEHNMFWSKDKSTTSETFEHFCLTIRQKAALSVYSMIATASQYSDLKQVSMSIMGNNRKRSRLLRSFQSMGCMLVILKSYLGLPTIRICVFMAGKNWKSVGLLYFSRTSLSFTFNN